MNNKSSSLPLRSPESKGSNRHQLLERLRVIQHVCRDHRGGSPHFGQVHPGNGEVEGQPLPLRPVLEVL